MGKMDTRLWIIGAFVTSMMTSALLTVLIFHYLQSRSRLAAAFAILICGVMLHLISQIAMQRPDTRLFGSDSSLGVIFFATAGSGLSVFGFANVALTLFRQRSLRRLKIGFAGLGCLAAGLTLTGFMMDGPELLQTARMLESIIVVTGSVTVLVTQSRILVDHIRRMSVTVSLVLLIAALMTVIRLLLIPSSTTGIPGPNWIQLTAMFLMVGTVLVFSGFLLVRTIRLHRELLNPLAVDEYELSRREQDIIREISKGGTNEEIASSLYISVSTVKNHIYRKTGSHNRVELLNAVMNRADG